MRTYKRKRFGDWILFDAQHKPLDMVFSTLEEARWAQEKVPGSIIGTMSPRGIFEGTPLWRIAKWLLAKRTYTSFSGEVREFTSSFSSDYSRLGEFIGIPLRGSFIPPHVHGVFTAPDGSLEVVIRPSKLERGDRLEKRSPGQKRSLHRVFVLCDICGELVDVGHFSQHQRGKGH